MNFNTSFTASFPLYWEHPSKTPGLNIIATRGLPHGPNTQMVLSAPPWSVAPLCCPIHVPPHASYHMGSCPPPSPTDRVGAGQLCSVHSSALNLGTGLGGLTPGQALRADTGGEWGPAAAAQQVLLLTRLPEQEGGHPGGERVWARLWW